MPDEAPLTADQQRILQAVYDVFRREGSWPTFGEVDRALYRGRRRLDVLASARTIPKSFLLPVAYGGTVPSPDAPMRLTLQGVAACEGSADDVALFLRALRWMAQREIRFRPQPAAETTEVVVTSQQVSRSLRLTRAEHGSLRRLGALLAVEDWGWIRGGGAPGQGRWDFTVGREVRRFGQVQSVDEYLGAQARRHEEASATAQPRSTTLSEPATLVEAVSPSRYVDAKVIADLKAGLSRSSWAGQKLLSLLEELNHNHAQGHPYATHALLRAVLDHIPPIFGYTSFNQVAESYPWGQTDNRYMRKLLAFKLQADDALHRQIGRRADRLDLEDLPQRRAVNRLLAECADRLGAYETGRRTVEETTNH
jgi:hypothetical protein